jgi:hypothetical protein
MGSRNRCVVKDDGRFYCGVSWETEAGPRTCDHFEHDTVFFWSQCERCAIGRCMSHRANEEVSRETSRMAQ